MVMMEDGRENRNSKTSKLKDISEEHTKYVKDHNNESNLTLNWI